MKMQKTKKELTKLLTLLTYFREKFPAECVFNTGIVIATGYEPYLNITVAPASSLVLDTWIMKPLADRPFTWRRFDTTRIQIQLEQTPLLSLLSAFTRDMWVTFQVVCTTEQSLQRLICHIHQLRGYTAMSNGDLVTTATSIMCMFDDLAAIIRAGVYTIQQYKDTIDDPIVEELRQGIRIAD